MNTAGTGGSAAVLTNVARKAPVTQSILIDLDGIQSQVYLANLPDLFRTILLMSIRCQYDEKSTAAAAIKSGNVVKLSICILR